MATDVEKRADAPPPASKEELEGFLQVLDGGEYPAERMERGAMADAIAKRIRAGETFEDVFRSQDEQLPGFPEDVPFTLHGFHLNPSSYWENGKGEGLSAYAVCDITRQDSGERITCSIGGRNVLEQLYKILQNGWWDKTYKLVVKDTAAGRTAYWLVPG